MPAVMEEVKKVASNAASHEASAGTRLVTQETGGIAGGISRTTGLISSSVMFVPMIGTLIGWLGKRKALSAVSAPLETVSKVARLPNAMVTEMPEKLHEIGLHKAASMASSAGGRITDFAQKTTMGSKVMGRLKESSGTNILFAGTMAVGEGMNTYLTIKTRIQTLQAMQSELTGKMPSKWEVIRNKGLHPLVEQARKQAFGGKAMFGMAAGVGGTIGNMLMMFSRMSGLKYIGTSIAISAGTGMVQKGLTAGDTAIDSYRALVHNFARNGKASVEDYKGLIGGFMQSAHDDTVTSFAKQAFVKQMRPKEALAFVSEISQGHLRAPAAAKNQKVVGPQTAALLAGKGAGRGMAMGATA